MKAKVKIKKAKVFSIFFNLCLCVFICGQLSSVFAQNDGSEQNVLGKAGTFAIVNARIVTVSGAVIENGTVLIQDGKSRRSAQI